MTFKEKLMQESHENLVAIAMDARCPNDFGYEEDGRCMNYDCNIVNNCSECWNREMPEVIVEPKVGPVDEGSRKVQMSMYEEIAKVNMAIADSTTSTDAQPHILDSGDRTEFETGAVRDMREGKGRCDLLPLDVVAEYLEIQKAMENKLDTLKRSNIRSIINYIKEFTESGNTVSLFWALTRFDRFCDAETMLLEVAKHFEEGAKKYGDNNWRKGIPVRCYIDSAIRHYLKYLRGDKDEPHDRAFCWNILCAIWTCKHMPELNDYAKKESEPT